MADGKSRLMSRRILSEILQPRAEEVFHLLWDEIRRAGFEKSLNSGIVLAGGGALLEGMSEIAEQIFDLPVRRASPAGVGGLADHVHSPAYRDRGRSGDVCASQSDRRTVARSGRGRVRTGRRATPDPVQRVSVVRGFKQDIDVVASAFRR